MITTIEELRARFSYDAETGLVTRLIASGYRNCHRAGELVGGVHHRKYLAVSINGKNYYIHRIAAALMTGEWPDGVIDHIDGNPSNNRWSNLRIVSRKVNMQNIRKPTAANRTGLLGVSYDKAREKFEGSVKTGRVRSRRRFDTAEEAHAFYLSEKRRLHDGCTI